jgi:hypothetical protein
LKVAYFRSLNTSSGIWLTAEELDGLPMDSFFSLKIGDGMNASKVFLPFKNLIWSTQYISSGVKQPDGKYTSAMTADVSQG